jgi:hypothetical protein
MMMFIDLQILADLKCEILGEGQEYLTINFLKFLINKSRKSNINAYFSKYGKKVKQDMLKNLDKLV